MWKRLVCINTKVYNLLIGYNLKYLQGFNVVKFRTTVLAEQENYAEMKVMFHSLDEFAQLM